MKRSINLAVALIVFTVLAFSSVFAQDDSQNKFKNTNENAVKNLGEEQNLKYQFQSQEMNQVSTQKGAKFVDLNGDGICDNFGNETSKSSETRKRAGKQDGSGNGYGKRYGNDSDFGKHQYGTGECDGTGPKGAIKGKGNNR